MSDIPEALFEFILANLKAKCGYRQVDVYYVIDCSEKIDLNFTLAV